MSPRPSTSRVSKTPFQCAHCNFHSKYKCSLLRHIVKRHIECKNAKPIKRSHRCSACSFECTLRSVMVGHFADVHDVKLETQSLKFPSQAQFLEWKSIVEKEERSRYVKCRGIRKRKTGGTVKYYCHREGSYSSKSVGKRHIKSQGSNKINSCCPAEMKVSISVSGEVEVDFVSTHFGHDFDLSRLHLDKSERQMIAQKLSENIPFDAILNTLCSSVPCDQKFGRIHLLTKKDLQNIARDYKIEGEASRLSNGECNIHSWIRDVEATTNIVRFFKPSGTFSGTLPHLQSEDFVLVMANDAQIAALDQYGDHCVCVDNTTYHNKKASDLELTTLFVLNKQRGFPAAFLISNRIDNEVLSVFFSVLKQSVGRGVETRVFMSTMSDIYWDAWCSTMPQPRSRMYSLWHLDVAWRKSLNRIKAVEKRSQIFKKLRRLVQEKDQSAFCYLVESVKAEFKSDDDTRSFGEYFDKLYFRNASLWACCYRDECCSYRANGHLESMHRTIKYLYMRGKKAGRLDRSIGALMRYIRDKLLDRMNVPNIKSVSSMASIRERHRESLALLDSSLLQTENGWSVSCPPEVYEVAENKKGCTCFVKCQTCNRCIHAFKCTCPDSSVKWNMCVHIHLVALSLLELEQAQEKVPLEIVPEETAEGDWQIDEDGVVENVENKLIIVHAPQEVAADVLVRNEEFQLQERLNSIRSHFQEILNETRTIKQIELLERLVEPILPTLRSVKETGEYSNVSQIAAGDFTPDGSQCYYYEVQQPSLRDYYSKYSTQE